MLQKKMINCLWILCQAVQSHLLLVTEKVHCLLFQVKQAAEKQRQFFASIYHQVCHLLLQLFIVFLWWILLIRSHFQILCFHWSYFCMFLLYFSTCSLLFVGMTRCRSQRFHLHQNPSLREKLHTKDLYIHIQKKISLWQQ